MRAVSNMKLESTLPATQAEYAESGMQAHSRRVAATAVELAKRLGWTVDQQRALREAAEVHHKDTAIMDPRCLNKLISDVWGYSGEETGVPREQSENMTR